MSKADIKDLLEVKKRITNHKQVIKSKKEQRLRELGNFDVYTIAEKFSYKIMQKEYKDFCKLYEKNETCHNLDVKNFNCYACYCPYYEEEITINEESGLYKIGTCKVKSKFGYYKNSQTRDERKKEYLILSCSNCTVPHRDIFIKKYIKSKLSTKNTITQWLPVEVTEENIIASPSPIIGSASVEVNSGFDNE